ncbi:MAG: efflux RND transporter periplasmic adaptor subunit [Burkholderiales bacterium]
MRVATLFLAVTIAAGCSKEAPAPQRPAPQVSVSTVTPQTIPHVMTFVAQTESSRRVDIVARISGFLERIAYREGELVKEGQVLFELDRKPLQAQLDAAQGQVLAQEARFATAKANLERTKPLAEQDALSRADLDRAQGDYDAAAAAVFGAKAKLREAEINLGYTIIRSPVTGLAGRALQRQGSYVNAMAESAQLSYVVAIDPVWVNFSVSQNQMTRIRSEMALGRVAMPEGRALQVALALSDGAAYPAKGTVDFADPSFSQDTGAFLVRAVVPNAMRVLRPGMFVTAKVEGLLRPDAIVIAQLAVQQGPKGHFVYVVKPDDVAELRPIVVGDYYGDKDIVIVEGLKAGERVVTDGVLKVVPGKPVQVVPAGAAAKL